MICLLLLLALIALLNAGLLLWVGVSINKNLKEIFVMVNEQETRLNEALEVVKGGVAALIALVAQLVANNPDLSDETASLTKLGEDIQTAIDNATGGGTVAPVAALSASPTSGTAPLSVSFSDASTGLPESWSYDFGDGSEPSTEQNPSHVYETPGSFTVTQTVTNAAGSSTATVSISVAEAVPE